MKNNYKAILLSVAVVLLCIVLSGCAKSYSMVSSDVYAYGERLQGPASGTPNASLILSNNSPRDGTSVEFKYAGTTYNGTVQSGFILWNIDPYIVSDATDMFTLISASKGTILLTHNCQIYGHWVEVRQVFEPERSSGGSISIITVIAIIAVVFGLIIFLSRQKKVNSLQKTTNSADEILRYKELYDQGVISEEEFHEKKKKLLGL